MSIAKNTHELRARITTYTLFILLFLGTAVFMLAVFFVTQSDYAGAGCFLFVAAGVGLLPMRENIRRRLKEML